MSPFEGFTQTACKTIASTNIQISEVRLLMDVLQESLKKEYPQMDPDDIRTYVKSKLTLECTNCGLMDLSKILNALRPPFESPLFTSATLAKTLVVHCPGCNGTTVKVTFDPTSITKQ